MTARSSPFFSLKAWPPESPGVRVNLGCGRELRKGWDNVDRNPGPGVKQADAAKHLPYADASVDVILAKHVLEHMTFLEDALREMARVLKPGGRLYVEVPYGFNGNPFHVRFFDKNSPYTMAGETRDGPTTCADADPGVWKVVSVSTVGQGFGAWHAAHYLGITLPIGLGGRNLRFVLERQ